MLERVLSWGLALTLSALLLAVALQALLGPSPHAVFGLIALKSGVPDVEPTGRYVVGALQAAAVLLLLLPRLRVAGGALAFVVSLGAVGMHLTPWLGVNLPLGDQATAALARGASAEEIANLPTDQGAMFLMALALLVLSLAVLVVERANIRAVAPGTRVRAGAFVWSNPRSGTEG